MPTAQDVVKMAQSQIGVKEVPANSNKVKYWDAYAPYWNGSPWCDRFVSWCGWKVGAADIVGVFDYCPSHVNWFKARDQWVDRRETPRPGDIIFFGDSSGVACHVGIVESATSSNNVITIEGNTSTTSNDNGGAVMRRTRTLGSIGSKWYIFGYGRPAYESEDDMPSAQEVANAVWAKGLKNWAGNTVSAETMLSAVDKELQRTDDPSGRKVALKDHDHIKWIAAKQADQDAKLDKIMAHLGIE